MKLIFHYSQQLSHNRADLIYLEHSISLLIFEKNIVVSSISQVNEQYYLDKIALDLEQYLLMFLQLLKELNQTHIIEAYLKATPEEQQVLDRQLDKIQKTYPGGLKVYYQNGLRLLKESAEGVNPYANYQIGKPQGLIISYDDLDTWEKTEAIGLKEMKHACFMLVAGGLGERLGYPGIKISIPKELLTEKSFIKYYCEYVRAYQMRYCENQAIPFAIMTSEDTHDATVEIIEKNDYFGLKKSQVTLLTQEKVPALIDNEAHFSLLPGKLQLETKPHGHGDVHTLLHMSGLAKKWHSQGRKWIAVFQDTNPFALRSFPLLLGISAANNYDFNTLGVPRKPGEALGAIAMLTEKESKKNLTINIEYNQVEAAFKELGGQPVNPDGTSQFPGNTNCFAIKLDTYVQVLERTQGLISEFINPKYADATKTKFKSSARLECMMQDYPKLLHSCDKVGYASVPKGYCFSALKNDLKSATLKHQQGLSGEGAPHLEADIYINNRHLLRLCGAEIEEGKMEVVSGSELAMFPMVSFSPFFATCLSELRHKVKKLWMHPRSSLIIESDCVLENVEVDGHMDIREHGNIVVKHVSKDYHSLEELDEEEQEPHLHIRGYKLKKQQPK